MSKPNIPSAVFNSAPLTPTSVQASAYTATANQLVPVDATSGAITITLPTAPADKTRMTVKKLDASTNIVTVASGSSDVFNKTGGSTSITLSLQNQSVTLQYTSSTSIWYVVSDDVSLSTLSATYVSQGTQAISVKDSSYGAKGNGKTITDAAMTSSSHTLSSSSAVFTASDVGKLLTIAGAAGGSALSTTINGFTNSTTVTLTGIATSTVSGAVATYGSNDSTAIQAAMDALGNSGGGILIIPPGLYLTSHAIVHRHHVNVRGGGRDATTIRNVQLSGTYATAMTWFFGTYGPGNASQGVPKQETGYTFNTVLAGAIGITMTTAGQESNFAVGDLVSLEGSTINSATLNTPNEMLIVQSIDTTNHLIIFDRPLLSDYPTGSGALTIRKLNVGSPATTSMVAMTPGLTAYALRSASITDVTVICDQDGYAPIDLACFECTISRVRTSGYGGLAGNPVARSEFTDLDIEYKHEAMEFAYLSHESYVRNSHFKRVGTDLNPSSAAGIWVNIGEGAKYIHFRDIELHDVRPSTSTSLANAVQMTGEGCTWRGGKVYAITPTLDIFYLGGAGSEVDGLTIWNGTGNGNGLTLNGSNNIVRGCRVYGTPVGKNAILIGAGATGGIVKQNILGRGIKTAADSVSDASIIKTNVKSDNTTFYTKTRDYSSFLNTLTGTTAETTRTSLSYGIGTLDFSHYFECNVTGATIGSATKTVNLYMDTHVFLAVTIPAAVTWSIRGKVGVSTNPSTCWYDFLVNLGGTLTPYTGTFVDGYPSSSIVSITETLANASDSILTYLCEIKYFNEHAALS